MQESVSFIKCLISGVWGGLSPAGCVPGLRVGLVEFGAGGLERLHPPLMFVGLGVPHPHGVSVPPNQPRGGSSEGLSGVLSSQATPFSCVRLSS